MKKPIVSAVRRISVLRSDAPFLLFFLVSAAGTVCGALSSKTADAEMLRRLDFLFLTNFELRSTQSVVSAFIVSFSSVTVFMLAAFFLGLSLWGCALCAAVPFFRGYGYGLTAGFICSTYGMNGFFYSLLVLLPGTFISCAALSFAALCSFRSSIGSIMHLMRSPVKDDPKAQLRSYTVKMLRLMPVCAVSGLADTLCSFVFSGLFSF